MGIVSPVTCLTDGRIESHVDRDTPTTLPPRCSEPTADDVGACAVLPCQRHYGLAERPRRPAGVTLQEQRCATATHFQRDSVQRSPVVWLFLTVLLGARESGGYQ